MSKLNSNRLGKTTYLEGIVTQDVLKACIAGHRESQELLYHYFSPKMFGICLRYGHDYSTAEDLLQEGFIKVFNKLHMFRYEGSFEGWMKIPDGYRTVFNLYAIEGYNHKEIGKMLGISEGTSKSQLARARATLQRNIKSLK